MCKSVFLIAIVLITVLEIRADQPRRSSLFSSASGGYAVTLKDHEWRLIEKGTGQERYRFSDYRERGIWFSSMTLVVSDDGQSIIAIDDYSQQDFRRNPGVLFFFHEGKIVKTYKLWDLAVQKFLTVSVSHFTWCFARPGKFGINGSEFKLTTLDLTNHNFDAKTGKLLFKKKDPSLSPSAMYVFGKVTGLGGTRHKIQVGCVIHGKANDGDTIFFDADTYRWEGSGHSESLVIDNGRLVSRRGVHFNVCHGETWR